MQSTLDRKVEADGSDQLCGRRAVRFQHLQDMLPRVPYRLKRDGWWLTNETRDVERLSMSSRQERW